MQKLNRSDCEKLDQQDRLACFREEFSLPYDDIYMSGNSLGAMPKKAITKAQEIITEHWGKSLIKSWNIHNWFTLSQTIGDKLAPTIGANEGEVVVTDATGINIFKVVSAALTLNPTRNKIVMEGSNFPTDNYTVQGLVKLLGDTIEIVFAEEEEGILAAIDESVAVVCITQVHYKSGRLLDMKKITEKTQACGSISVWDLCHSGGALPIDLNACNVDFAIGCTYKYYNGGPGSPAFIFCAKRHQGKALQPLTGWYSHAEPFAFERDYRPANNINQMLSGTQCIISLAVSEIGIDITARANMNKLRSKSLKLGQVFMQLIEQELGDYGLARFDSPLGSVEGYMFNINTTTAYAKLRALRAQLRANGDAIAGMELAGTLDKYSERGQAYIDSIREMISYNKLQDVDEAYLSKDKLIHLTGK